MAQMTADATGCPADQVTIHDQKYIWTGPGGHGHNLWTATCGPHSYACTGGPLVANCLEAPTPQTGLTAGQEVRRQELQPQVAAALPASATDDEWRNAQLQAIQNDYQAGRISAEESLRRSRAILAGP